MAYGKFLVVLLCVALAQATNLVQKDEARLLTTATDSDSSVTIGTSTVIFAVLLVLLIGVAGAMLGAYQGDLFQPLAPTAYAAPAYAHGESSYTSIHRSLEDAASKYQ